jgi:hypothetical protein
MEVDDFVSNFVLDTKDAIKQGEWKRLEEMVISMVKSPKRFLVDFGLSSDEHRTLMHYAASHGRPECVRVLLTHGFSTNSKGTRSGETPLHLAVGNLACLELMLAHQVLLLVEETRGSPLCCSRYDYP